MEIVSGIISPIVRLLTKACLELGEGSSIEKTHIHPDNGLIRVLVSNMNFRVEE
jgi:hypothetical protein